MRSVAGCEFFGADQVVFATDAPLGPIAPTIKIDTGAQPRARRRTQALLRKCREASENEILDGVSGPPFGFLRLVSPEPTPWTGVQLGGSLAGKLSSELTTTLSSSCSIRSRSFSISRFGFSIGNSKLPTGRFFSAGLGREINGWTDNPFLYREIRGF